MSDSPTGGSASAEALVLVVDQRLRAVLSVGGKTRLLRITLLSICSGERGTVVRGAAVEDAEDRVVRFEVRLEEKPRAP